ncbi:MAG: glycoside hydrolase family 32 protein [Isosphaeraceae bacterium]
MRTILMSCALAMTLGGVWSHADQVEPSRPDILIADFEGSTYGAWKATGEAFGPGPAQGTLPGQMAVSGYLGKGLVNSFFHGDHTTGTLTSTPFKIERKCLNFLIGGGGYPGETCMNLNVAGKVVRTATGPNREPGGSEHLRRHTWDVRDFPGAQAVLEIVDRRTGGWGHINIDQIVQSDEVKQARPARRELEITHRYLHLPVRTGAPKAHMKLSIADKTIREFEIELAEGKPHFWVFSDLEPYRGKLLRIEVEELAPGSRGLAAITQADDIPDAAHVYQEASRPQFHFTSRRGWHNDPNGLVYQAGKYHLFYQHNPYGWNWGNMHWGHAVSADLVHWKEQPVALYPREFGDWCFSGSAVVDEHNTSGFQDGRQPPLVAAFTSTGRGECIVFSNDQGKTWKEYAGNPVVKHPGRNPRLLWYKPGNHWVMAVYDETGGRQGIAFQTSPDLKHWTFRSKIDGFFECPDLFELPIEGQPGQSRWVLYAADGKYMLGDFDGRAFHPTSGKDKLQLWYGNFYAAQTFSNTPDGRRIQIGWANGVTFPGMPFNQQMTIPVELTLRSTEDGLRMFALHSGDWTSIRTGRFSLEKITLTPGENPLRDVRGELFDISLLFKSAKAESLVLDLRGTRLVYDCVKQELVCKNVRAPLRPFPGGVVWLHVLLDRGSIEVFGNLGRVAMSVAAIANHENRSVGVVSQGGPIDVNFLVVNGLRSAWDFP